MDTLLQNLRYAVRALRKAPTFSLAAIGSACSAVCSTGSVRPTP